MYRIFCESYDNYTTQNSGSDYRSKLVNPFALIVDSSRYEAEKRNKTHLYKQLSDLLYFMEQNINKYPRFDAFLWTIESRGMTGKHYGVASQEDLYEQAKLANMFLKLILGNLGVIKNHLGKWIATHFRGGFLADKQPYFGYIFCLTKPTIQNGKQY